MFFLLSKTLDFLLTPLFWASALVALGLWSRRRS
ncbi:MAG: YdcF family protein, partial [Myxococcales bacterium]|nr:YdcF family protein [Myxococcales bacterium]